jgi:hypothetical protein
MRKLIITSLLLSIGSVIVFAAAEELRYNEGDCGNGTKWWYVVKVIGGRPCEMWGVDCNGILFSRDLHCMNVSADPTGGIHTHSGTGDNGVNWYMRVERNRDQRITWIGGKDQNGNYYETEMMYGDPGPGGLE